MKNVTTKNAIMKKATAVTAAKIAAVMLAASAAMTGLAPVTAYAAERTASAGTTSAGTGSTLTAAQAAVDKDTRLSDVDTAKQEYYQPVFVDNRSGQTLEELYIAASEDASWGDDIMGEYYLPDDGSMWRAFPVHDNYTSYDVSVVFKDGTRNTYSGFDFSHVSTEGFTLEFDENSVTAIY